MSRPAPAPASHGTNIPPEIYDVGFGWDPQPEVHRLLFLARECGGISNPQRVLELGCGTGRLLAALRGRVTERVGLELSPAMAEFARARSEAEVVAGDMSDFSLEREFDLIFTSANTLRYVTAPAAICGMWRCIAAHLAPGGVFIADLELGRRAAAENLAKPQRWSLTRGERTVDVTWEIIATPAEAPHLVRIRLTFDLRSAQQATRRWQEEFIIRTYDGDELVSVATEEQALQLAGAYLLRDPYLIPCEPARIQERGLLVLRKADSAPPSS